MRQHFKGTGGSSGIAIGKAVLLNHDQLNIVKRTLSEQEIPDEIHRFRLAVRVARRQLRIVKKKIMASTTNGLVSFIDSHLLMLQGATLTQVPLCIIQTQRCNAEWALKLQHDTLVDIFDNMDDDYLKTRKNDVDDVITRIQRILLRRPETVDSSKDNRLKGHIVVADDLAPDEIITLVKQGIIGFVTEKGGVTSHAAIVARSLQMPGVVGVGSICHRVQNEASIVIDAECGDVFVNVDSQELACLRKRQALQKKSSAKLLPFSSAPAKTLDGTVIKLYANIELLEDIAEVKRVCATGIGLYRTEFLFVNRTELPTEEDQFDIYVKMIRSLRGMPITIRTLDLGMDKLLSGSNPYQLYRTTNPALGLRGVRLCLKEPGLFMPQLRAILRASFYGPVRLMIPMLSNLDEIRQVMAMIDEVKQDLRKSHHAFDPNLAIGGMIETPAAALSAPAFAQHLDFLSLGTNDLIQYTVAIDRNDEQVQPLYDPLHPSVLQLINMTLKAGEQAGIPVGMCGEMAANVNYTRLLLGMGLREFSVCSAVLPTVKTIINHSGIDELRRLADGVLQQQDMNDIRALLEADNTSAMQSLNVISKFA